MTAPSLLVFGNVSQPPYCNNLLPAVRAFEAACRTTLVEPIRFPTFVPTGGASPALVPDDAVEEHVGKEPDIVVCLGGALHFSERALRLFPAETVLAGFALSDPYGLPASLAIAPQFDLFYTQDSQALPEYAARGVRARRCDPATDAELYFPEGREPECDILYYGKWTPYRDTLAAALAGRLRLHLHAYAGETRWSVPVQPQLSTPAELRSALARARLALETALLDDAEGPWRGKHRITPRAFFAASCGVPALVESFASLSDFFAPGAEIATFAGAGDVADAARTLLADESARLAMARRARERVLREHTWERRIASFLFDVRERRARPRVRAAL